MCVVCAYVGCGVYKNKHANAHYADTQHPFAINLEECTFWSGEKLRAGSVWDYSSERFVNRLLTSEDGKIVELATEASNSASGADSTRGEACCAAEMGIVEDEDNDRGLQAAVYASRMDAVVDEYRARLKRVEGEHATEKAALDAEMQRVKEELAKSRREKKGLQKKVADLDKEGKRLKEGNGFLKNLYEALLRDKCGWNDEVEKVRKLLKECEEGKRAVEEQLRDVMMHFEAQAKIGAGSESCRSGASELRGGDVLRVGPTPRERLAMRPKRR